MADTSSGNKDLTLRCTCQHGLPVCNYSCAMVVTRAGTEDILKYFGHLPPFASQQNRDDGHSDFQSTDMMPYEPNSFDNLPAHHLN